MFYFSRSHNNISNPDLDWRELAFMVETGCKEMVIYVHPSAGSGASEEEWFATLT